MIKKAICVLCIKPNPIHIDFYSKFAEYGYSVYFVCDDNNTIIEPHSNITFIQIPDDMCREKGFIKCTLMIEKTPVAYDKALYYFTQIDDTYDSVWFLEDDVFVPNITTITDIDYKYNENVDLLIENFIHYNTSKSWSNWRFFPENTYSYSYHAMVCCVRVSKTLLSVIKDYAAKNRTLYFHEIMIPTLAIKNNLVVKKIPELEYITYNETFNVLHIYSDKIYHPMKNLKQHVEYRKMFV